ncbi:MAG TPA: DSD1 family PLP-dependent enzyme [Spirochaetes bacterium]|nr:DSD1 family PLP-dependent enzyme [Spirochaetota bacterium]
MGQVVKIKREQIETPALVIDLDILERNISVMTDFMKDKRAKLRPHFKTYKCPAISHKQISAGAKGITCAKLGEAEVLVQSGIKDVLIANQIVDPVKIFRLAALADDEAKITVAVDDPDNILALSNAAAEIGSTVYVLVEIDVGMKRCGVNTPDEVFDLAGKIVDSKGLVFEGFQAYEGHLQNRPDIEDRRRGVKEMEEKVGEIKNVLEKRGIPVKEISGAGTGTYNITADNTIWTEIQAGSYIFSDAVYNKIAVEFQNSLSVLTQVIHKRPGYAVTDAGMKVCTVDHGIPEIKNFTDLKIYGNLSEEHGTIIDEKDELEMLQKIEYIPGHCCTTVNLHDRYYCVRKGLLEAVWPILGRGKSR